MYRALALKAIQNDADLDSETELMALAAGTRIVLEPQLGGNRVLLDGVAVSQRLREPDVTAAASRVSVHPQVRRWMVDQQRSLGVRGGVVMEGRDIGTVVFPDAEVKIFLDAAPEVRGNRRYRQTEPAGAPETEAAVLQELRERDARDRNRAESPLRPAADATVLDTTNLELSEVLERVDALVGQWMGGAHLPLE
jgi:CMP/dCMP kinase